MTNYDDVELEKFLEENADLMDDLASAVMCPACGCIARPPLSNLGARYHWAEGHSECADDQS